MQMMGRWLGLLLLAGLAVAAFWPLSAHWRFVPLLTDALHTPAAAVLLLILQLWLRRYLRRQLILMVAFLLLVGIEVLQPLAGRAAEWHDVFNGMLGLALVWYWHHLSWLRRIISTGCALLLGAYGLISALLVQAQLKAALPDLMEWPLLDTAYGWQALPQSALLKQRLAQNKLQLTTRLSGQRWQGVVWQNPALDLTGIREMCFSARASQVLSLQIRIDDNSSYHYASRFDTSVQLQPGWQRFCLDLSSLTDKSQRQMDKSRLNQMYFFAKSPTRDGWFNLAQVQLKP